MQMYSPRYKGGVAGISASNCTGLHTTAFLLISQVFIIIRITFISMREGHFEEYFDMELIWT
jgi:hypothetical protein